MPKENKEVSPFYHGHLESTDDVGNTLDWKINSLNEKELPVEAGIADYIALSFDNIDLQEKQIKILEEQIKDRKKEIAEQKELIKVEGAKFFQRNGFDKLNGVICSSVSLVTAKDEKRETYEVEEVVINITPEEVEELLIGLGKAERKTVTKEKVIKATPARIKVNKRQPKKVKPKEIGNEAADD